MFRRSLLSSSLSHPLISFSPLASPRCFVSHGLLRLSSNMVFSPHRSSGSTYSPLSLSIQFHFGLHSSPTKIIYIHPFILNEHIVHTQPFLFSSPPLFLSLLPFRFFTSLVSPSAPPPSPCCAREHKTRPPLPAWPPAHDPSISGSAAAPASGASPTRARVHSGQPRPAGGGACAAACSTRQG